MLTRLLKTFPEAGITAIYHNSFGKETGNALVIGGRPYITACDYCDNSQIFPLVKVVPGEQDRPRECRHVMGKLF
jgi:hypothetical protein